MKRYDISLVVLNSNVLVVIAIVTPMLLNFFLRDCYVVRGVNTFLLVAVAVLFTVYVEWRILYRPQRIAVVLSALMIVLELTLVQMKYSFFLECDTVTRKIWYAFYIPYILVPLFILYASMYLGTENKKRRIGIMIITSVVSVVLIALIMTNDMHQWIFRFEENYVNWNSQYEYGVLIIPVYVWIVALFVNTFVTLLRKCSIIKGKKYSWQVLCYVGFLWLLSAVDAVTNLQEFLFGERLISNSALFCAMSISFLLCCIRLWLIPAEVDYYLLNESIENVNEQLKEESEIIRLRNELQREQTAIQEKNELYDNIAQSVAEQSEKILCLTQNKDNLPLICFYGAYIKRISNLKLIAFDNARMSVFELLLSVRESARYLEKTGILVHLSGHTERFVESEIVIESYKYLQNIIEKNMDMLQGMCVTFPKDGDVLMRVVLEGVTLPTEKEVLHKNLTYSGSSEDDVSYLTFSIGGETQ